VSIFQYCDFFTLPLGGSTERTFEMLALGWFVDMLASVGVYRWKTVGVTSAVRLYWLSGWLAMLCLASSAHAAQVRTFSWFDYDVTVDLQCRSDPVMYSKQKQIKVDS
jgi:hypothetical protein